MSTNCTFSEEDSVPVANFPGYYVDWWGNIWSFRRKGRRGPLLLAKTPNRDGYLGVVLFTNEGKKCVRLVSCLALESFVGPRPPGMQCAHLDGVKTNNCILNLKWKTPKDNELDKWLHGTAIFGERQWKSKLKEPEVVEIRRRVLEGERHRKLSEEFGVSMGNIGFIGRGETWKHLWAG